MYALRLSRAQSVRDPELRLLWRFTQPRAGTTVTLLRGDIPRKDALLLAAARVGCSSVYH